MIISVFEIVYFLTDRHRPSQQEYMDFRQCNKV